MDLVFNGTRISLALQLQHQKCSKKKFSVIKIFKGIIIGVPVVVQWKRIRLGTMKLWVRSLVSLSGLRIQRYRELWCRSQTRLGSGVAVALA